MTKKIVSCILLIVLFWLQLYNTAAAESETDLKLYARAAVLMDAQNGRILYEENADAVMPIASTTKILTCILALQSGKTKEVVTVSKNACSQPKVKLYLKEGRQYLLNDLLYSLMLESHNDTAVAIAEHIGGSMEGFAELMNALATEIGCTSSYFVTPNGLDAKRNGKIHSSTARDMAKIAAYAMQNEEFRNIIQTSSYSFSDIHQEIQHTVRNKDAFLTMYNGAVGIKTGFTGGAGYCFVGAVRRDGKEFISVVLASGWPPNKSWKWKDTIQLMDYGMNRYEYAQIPEITIPARLKVMNGRQEYVEIKTTQKDVILLLSDTDTTKIGLELTKNLTAPIQESECVGYKVYYVNDEEYLRVPITVVLAVDKYDFPFALSNVIRIFFV